MTDLVNPRHAICRVRVNGVEGTAVSFDREYELIVVLDDGSINAFELGHVTVIPQPAEEQNKEERDD